MPTEKEIYGQAVERAWEVQRNTCTTDLEEILGMPKEVAYQFEAYTEFHQQCEKEWEAGQQK